MKLIIDIGNTLTKLAFFADKELIKAITISEFCQVELKKITEQNPSIDFIILSSVIDYPQNIRDYLNASFQLIELSSETSLPIKNLYKTPQTLGNDRLAAVVGASILLPGKNVLVIDIGTCIKYDFINSSKEYLGGAISPGLEMRLKALHSFTNKLPLIESEDYNELIGTSTKDSILAGVQIGAAAEVEKMIEYYTEIYPDINIVLTGGGSQFLSKKLKNTIFAAPNLVLQGLNEILDYNVQKF